MSEEINLTTLFTLVSKTIKRHWLLVVVLFAGGVITGLLSVTYLLPKKYVSQAVFRSTYLSAADIEMNLNHINAVLLADTALPNAYLPYAGCKNFSVKAEDKGNAPDPLNSECDELSVKREFMRPFEDPLVLKHEEMHPMMGVYSPLWSP